MMALLGAHSLYCERQAATTVTEAPSLVCSSLGWRRSRLGVGQGQAGCPPQLPLCTPQSQMHQQLPMGYGGGGEMGTSRAGGPTTSCLGALPRGTLASPSSEPCEETAAPRPGSPRCPGQPTSVACRIKSASRPADLGKKPQSLGPGQPGEQSCICCLGVLGLGWGCWLAVASSGLELGF